MLVFMIMAYSTDLRKRVLDFVNTGGSKAEAERTFCVSRRTIYNWLETPDPLACEKQGPKGLDYDAFCRTCRTLRCGCISFRHPITRPMRNNVQQSVKFILMPWHLKFKREVKLPFMLMKAVFPTQMSAGMLIPRGISVSDKISGSHRYDLFDSQRVSVIVLRCLCFLKVLVMLAFNCPYFFVRLNQSCSVLALMIVYWNIRRQQDYAQTGNLRKLPRKLNTTL